MTGLNFSGMLVSSLMTGLNFNGMLASPVPGYSPRVAPSVGPTVATN